MSLSKCRPTSWFLTYTGNSNTFEKWDSCLRKIILVLRQMLKPAALVGFACRFANKTEEDSLFIFNFQPTKHGNTSLLYLFDD